MEENEKSKFLNALVYPVFFSLILIIIHLLKYLFNWNLDVYGVYPRTISGLKGIFFAPLIHANFNHLINNVITFFILMLGLFYFYE